jgi:FlaA1/EpsC-like NDP-sugar epimerase
LWAVHHPVHNAGLPERRSVLLVLPGIGALGISLWRLAYAKLVAQPQFTRRCLVVGAGWAGRELVRVLTENPTKETDAGNYAGYGVLGLIDDDPEKEGHCIGNIPVLGKSTDLVQLARQYRVDELILAITHISAIQPRLFQAILACRQAGVRVTNMTTVYELVTGRLPLEHAGGNLDVVTLLSTRGSARLFLAAKRVLDIVVGLAMFLIALLIAPLLWLANRLTSPGPLFYTQNRVKDGRFSISSSSARWCRMLKNRPGSGLGTPE